MIILAKTYLWNRKKIGGLNLVSIKNHEKIILDIYSKIYINVIESQTTIFLCGGAKTNPCYIRDDVRELAIAKKGVNILYPEDMFVEMLEKDKLVTKAKAYKKEIG